MLRNVVCEYTTGKIDQPINFPPQQEWYSRTRNLYVRSIMITVLMNKRLTKHTNNFCSIPSWINIRNKAKDTLIRSIPD